MTVGFKKLIDSRREVTVGFKKLTVAKVDVKALSRLFLEVWLQSKIAGKVSGCDLLAKIKMGLGAVLGRMGPDEHLFILY